MTSCLFYLALFHSFYYCTALVSTQFLFLFLIAEHVKGTKFSITTINHYQNLTRTPSKTESAYLEYGKLPLPALKKILDLGPP